MIELRFNITTEKSLMELIVSPSLSLSYNLDKFNHNNEFLFYQYAETIINYGLGRFMKEYLCAYWYLFYTGRASNSSCIILRSTVGHVRRATVLQRKKPVHWGAVAL